MQWMTLIFTLRQCELNDILSETKWKISNIKLVMASVGDDVKEDGKHGNGPTQSANGKLS